MFSCLVWCSKEAEVVLLLLLLLFGTQKGKGLLIWKKNNKKNWWDDLIKGWITNTVWEDQHVYHVKVWYLDRKEDKERKSNFSAFFPLFLFLMMLFWILIILLQCSSPVSRATNTIYCVENSLKKPKDTSLLAKRWLSNHINDVTYSLMHDIFKPWIEILIYSQLGGNSV